jgi:hypothetical protein
MGAWASGNFDNDAALDFLSDVIKNVDQDLKPPEEVEEIDMLMAAVTIRKALVELCHANAPPREQIEELKDAVLQIYDDEIDGLEPDEEYKIERRQVIEKTFDDFLKLLKE